MNANNEALGISDALAELVSRTERSVVRVDGRRAPASGFICSNGVVVTADHN